MIEIKFIYEPIRFEIKICAGKIYFSSSQSLELIRFRRATDGEQVKEGTVKGEEGWLIERLAP